VEQRSLLAALAWLGWICTPALGRADEPRPSTAQPAGESAQQSEAPPGGASADSAPAADGAEAADRHRTRYVNFRAGRVDLDAELSELELSDDVVVQVDRYRLTSDRLKLHRGPSGIEVEGDGSVAFCPCPDPPVTIGFDAATVAPPTDLVIEDPTLRVGGVPVLWFPYLWLRSPDRAGLLPPQVAWRGEDGLLMGSGVHLPLGPRDRPAERWTVQLAGAGYLEGGADVQARLDTPQSTTRVRWDHLRETLLAVDAHGASSRADGAASAAWRVDALRGPRASRGSISLEEASRRYDRAEATVAHYGSSVVAGTTLRADSHRAQGLDRLGAAGPRAYLGYTDALGSFGTTDASLTATTVQDAEQGAASLALHRRSFRIDTRPGPLVASAELVHQAVATSTEQDDGAVLSTRGRMVLGLPLVRAFGSGPDPLWHWIEPLVQCGAHHGAHVGNPLDPSWVSDGAVLHAGGGVRTSLGRYGSRGAGSLAFVGGWTGAAGRMTPSVGARASARGRWAQLRADAAWLPERDDALVSLLHARVGKLDSLNLSGYLQGRLHVEPVAARWWLAPDPGHAPSTGWLAPAAPDRDEGWTAGGHLAVPWTSWLASSAAVDHDLTAQQLLAVRGALGYRHRCRCLAAAAWVGHRIGRPGVDAALTVDLVP
jgi:hypothetical protein